MGKYPTTELLAIAHNGTAIRISIPENARRLAFAMLTEDINLIRNNTDMTYQITNTSASADGLEKWYMTDWDFFSIKHMYTEDPIILNKLWCQNPAYTSALKSGRSVRFIPKEIPLFDPVFHEHIKTKYDKQKRSVWKDDISHKQSPLTIHHTLMIASGYHPHLSFLLLVEHSEKNKQT